MHCVGDSPNRFLVLAGPDPCADRPEAVEDFRLEADQAGVEGLRIKLGDQTRFRFELEAQSPESACSLVTTLLQAVYGMNWWAEVVSLCAAQRAIAEAAVWN